MQNIDDFYGFQNENLIIFTHERFILDKAIKNKLIYIYEYFKSSHTPNFPNFLSKELENIKLEKAKKFIDCYIPVTTCNFRCPYCYITQSNKWSDALPEFKYQAKHIRKALSKERLGGAVCLNMCAGGETLLHPFIIELLKELLEEGHYIWVVTNGSLNKRFEEIRRFPKDSLYRLAFKFSFHYRELIRTNKMSDYFDNINKMKDAGCSFSVELTPYDDIIKDIENIKKLVKDNTGNICHITIARDDSKKGIPILTNLSKEEYNKIWNQFDSKMFSFKLKHFQVKRKEYCYAGKWTYFLDIGSGNLKQCYPPCHDNEEKNIFENIKEPIELKTVGKKCMQPYCINGHAFLTFGAIPKLKTPYYYEMRNRVCPDGSEWLNPYMKEFCSHKLEENNGKSILNLINLRR